MPQLNGREQRVLVQLLIENLVDPHNLDQALLLADMGGISAYSELGTFPFMAARVVRKCAIQYRAIELVEAALSGDFLEGECPPLREWLSNNRVELDRRRNSPSPIEYILDKVCALDSKMMRYSVVAVIGVALFGAASSIYFYKRMFQWRVTIEKNMHSRPDDPPPAPTTSLTPTGQVAMPLTIDQVERLRSQLRLAPEELKSRSRFWPPGATITLAFLNGDQEARDFVKAVAKDWEQHVSLRFKYDDDLETSEVRISFSGPSSYSYLGTDCLGIEKTALTMQLGSINESSDADKRRFVVLHEFGHMLGFINEHQSPNSSIIWNWQRVSSQLGMPINQVHENFDRVTSDSVPREYLRKPLDPASVLMFSPIPEDWLASPLSEVPKGRLSTGDIEFAKKIYPPVHGPT